MTILSENGKDDIEKILRVHALDELEALRSIYFAGLNSVMTTCHGLHNPLSDMVSTTKKGISGLTGQFPEEMIGDIYPRFFTQYLYNGPDLGGNPEKSVMTTSYVLKTNRTNPLSHQ